MCETTTCLQFAGIFIFGILMGLALARKVLWQAKQNNYDASISSDMTREIHQQGHKNTSSTKQITEHHQLNVANDKSFLTDLLTTMIVISLFFIFILSLEA